jgi:hypothetical protein
MALLGAWAAAVGVPAEEIARHINTAQRAHVIHAAIGLRRMLLVIDDAWQLDEALAFKVGGPNCVHLLTTRPACCRTTTRARPARCSGDRADPRAAAP